MILEGFERFQKCTVILAKILMFGLWLLAIIAEPSRFFFIRFNEKVSLSVVH